MQLKLIGKIDKNGISEFLNGGVRGNIFNEDAVRMENVLEKYLPEREKIHHKNPQWLKDNVIDVLNDTEISVSFVTEGAGYRNTLGFFIYETKNQPKSISEIDTAHIIFANCSKVNSGGNLRSGDTMQLPFSYDEDKFNYTFPSGYSVGFLLFSDAWNGVDVKRNIRPYSSISKLNPENAQELKYHTVCILPEEVDSLLIGFEDIDRESPSCDHDFNDCVFMINTDIKSISRKYHTFNYDAPVDKYITVYKKILSTINNKTVECVATLFIPTSSIIMKKLGNIRGRYRTNNAYVDSILAVKPKSSLFTTDYIGYSLTDGFSLYKNTFKYEVGKYVSSDMEENSYSGIYFHYTFQEAADYIF